MGFFFPGPRLEVGGSWQKTLQDDRKNAFGFHMGWQPAKVPLNLRSEFARSFEGSGYWIEGAYRLSQVALLAKGHAPHRGGRTRAAVLTRVRSVLMPTRISAFPAPIRARRILESTTSCEMA